MKGVIYCYHCILTGKKYIGQTLYEMQRKSHHLWKSKTGNSKFYRAVRKYGWENFIYGIVNEFDVVLLNEKETFYIQTYDTLKNGYNSTLGGDGMFGYVMSKETKNKISVKNSGKKHSEETKLKLKEKRIGRKFSKDIIEKRNNTRKKNNPQWHSKQVREKISIRMKENKYCVGREVTEETKKKIAESVKGNKNNLGKKWWNNGQNSKMSVECPGIGWIPGRCLKN